YLMANLDFIEREVRQSRAAQPSIVGKELSDAITESRQGIERVGLIVRDLKTFTRDDDGTPIAVDVCEVCDASIRMVESEIRQRARLKTHSPAGPVFVRANETRLVQVLLNLLINSVHAIPSGQADRNLITVAVRKHDATVEIKVTNTGSGMTLEVLTNATRPF